MAKPKTTTLDAKSIEWLSVPSNFMRGKLGMPLYPEQCEVADSIMPDGARVTGRFPNEYGKTSYIIAGWILWHITFFPKGIALSTSGAWPQITHQLVAALRRWMPWSWEKEGYRLNQDSLMRPNGTAGWVGFSTNNPGFAEGYHSNGPDAPLLCIADEAKTVPDEIIDTMEDRCRPNRMALMSSCGGTVGRFYESHTKNSALYTARFHRSAMQCPHISRENIERTILKYGENHPMVRSSIFGEFMEALEGGLIPYAAVEKCMMEPPDFNRSTERHAFLDFGAGGDENVLAFRQGNRVKIVDAFYDKDTMSACGRLIIKLNQLKREHGLKPEEVEGDADGLGIGFCNRMAEMGWPIVHFHANSRPVEGRQYHNRSAEVWASGADQIKEHRIILPDDNLLKAQLINRTTKPRSDGLIQLESKEQMKQRRVGSPDRADAVLGAMASSPFTGFTSLQQKKEWDIFGREVGDDREVLAGCRDYAGGYGLTS
jgi:phage terminase large subunit